MEIIISKEYKDFSKKYKFTPAVKKGNTIYTSAIFGSVFNDEPDFVTEKSCYTSTLTKLGEIKIGKSCLTQAELIMYHMEHILKEAGAKLDDVVNLNISFMHKVKKTDMIPALQLIKSKFKNIPAYTLGRMDFPALKGVLMQVSAVAII